MKYIARFLIEHTESLDWGETWRTVVPRVDLERIFTPEELPRVKVSNREWPPEPLNGFVYGKVVIAEIERE